MKAAAAAIALVGLLVSGVADAQAMFRGDATHDGAYRGDGPRELHRVKWKFPTGDRIVSSPVYQDGVDLLRRRRRQCLRRGRGRRAGSSGSAAPAARSRRRRRSPAASLYVGSYDGKFYALDAKTGADAVEVQRPAASGDSRRKGCTASNRRTRRSRMRSTSSCRARSWAAARCISAAATATSTRSMPLPERSTGNSGRAMWCTPRPRTPMASCSSAAGTATSTRSTPGPAPRSGAFTAGRIR